MAGIRETLKVAVRQMSFRTSLDKLKKKGVKNVNVLGIDRIISLIEAAVYRSLKTRLVGLEREAVAESTKAEFLRLLRSNEDLQREKSQVDQARERAEDEIDLMRRELGEKRSALKVKLEQDSVEFAMRYDGENAEIAMKVASVVGSLVEAGDVSVGSLEGRLIELVMDVIAGERAEAEVARKALQDREVGNLQRRIKKLNDTLVSTEHRLSRASAMKSVDEGISSIYRDVQGLDESESHSGKKNELMADLFKANLKLQNRAKRA